VSQTVPEAALALNGGERTRTIWSGAATIRAPARRANHDRDRYVHRDRDRRGRGSGDWDILAHPSPAHLRRLRPAVKPAVR
jgi:hypothetical protein